VDSQYEVIDNALEKLKALDAKKEIKEIKEIKDSLQKIDQENAEMNKSKEEFEAEKEKIVKESADQRLPEFKKRIFKLQEEEKRIGSVA